MSYYLIITQYAFVSFFPTVSIIICVCVCFMGSAIAARVIYEVPHIDSEVADMDKHSTSSSKGSFQWVSPISDWRKHINVVLPNKHDPDSLLFSVVKEKSNSVKTDHAVQYTVHMYI